jgi:hypothetical protein
MHGPVRLLLAVGLALVATSSPALATGTGPWLVFVPGQLLFLVVHITFEPEPFGEQPDVVRGRSLDLCDVLA